jgi:hypothetical protein
MTEEQWLTGAEPGALLAFVRDQASERKLRLFACACCRRVWRLVPEAPGWAAVKAAERHADGLADRRELSTAQLEAERAHHRRTGGAAWDAAGAAGRFAFLACLHAARTPLDADTAREAAECARAARLDQIDQEALAQAALLRDILGNPFRPVQADPAWRTPAVRAQALAVWEERRLPGGELDPARLAALADALMAAGCTNAALLDHLRGPGPQVRGCFAVDLCLDQAGASISAGPEQGGRW